MKTFLMVFAVCITTLFTACKKEELKIEEPLSEQSRDCSEPCPMPVGMAIQIEKIVDGRQVMNLDVFYNLFSNRNGKIDVTFLSDPSNKVIGRISWESLPPNDPQSEVFGVAHKNFTFPKILLPGEKVIFVVNGKTNCLNPCSEFRANYTYLL